MDEILEEEEDDDGDDGQAEERAEEATNFDDGEQHAITNGIYHHHPAVPPMSHPASSAASYLIRSTVVADPVENEHCGLPNGFGGHIPPADSPTNQHAHRPMISIKYEYESGGSLQQRSHLSTVDKEYDHQESHQYPAYSSILDNSATSTLTTPSARCESNVQGYNIRVVSTSNAPSSITGEQQMLGDCERDSYGQQSHQHHLHLDHLVAEQQQPQRITAHGGGAGQRQGQPHQPTYIVTTGCSGGGRGEIKSPKGESHSPYGYSTYCAQPSYIHHHQQQHQYPVYAIVNGSEHHQYADELTSEGEYSTSGGQNQVPQGQVPPSFNDIEELNTRELAQRISQELKRYSIPQAIFAQKVLCRSQGTLSDLLRNPKPWGKLKSGRETFRRMAKWLQEPEYQRMSALRIAACKRKEEQSYQAHLQNLQLATGTSAQATSCQLLAESTAPVSTSSQCSPASSSTTQVGVASSAQSKRPRLVFTDIQRRTLQAIFRETKRPSREMQLTIAQQLGLDPTTVANFFMNARRRGHDVRSASSTANDNEGSEEGGCSNAASGSSSNLLLPALQPILNQLAAENNSLLNDATTFGTTGLGSTTTVRPPAVGCGVLEEEDEEDELGDEAFDDEEEEDEQAQLMRSRVDDCIAEVVSMTHQ